LEATVVIIVLCTKAIAGKEWVAYDGVGSIVTVHFEAVDFYFFEATVCAQS
jgi:hypothetical protein